MKKTLIIFSSILWLVLLSACARNNQTPRFNKWNLEAPRSELLYRYSDKDRGFHGDGIDCFVFRFTTEYKDYINSFLIEHEIDLSFKESVSDFSNDISHEIFQVANNDITDYFISMTNINIAQVPQENNKLIIIVDEINEKITFVFSIY